MAAAAALGLFHKSNSRFVMDNIKVLRQTKADTLAKGEVILAKATADKRALTDDERKTYDQVLADAKAIQGDIERVEAHMELLRNSGTVEDPNVTAAGEAARAAAPNAGKKPFDSFGEFLLAVVKAGKSNDRVVDPRLLGAASGMGEGVPADGGYQVQNDWSDQLLQKSYDTGIVARKVTRIPLSANSNGIKLPAIDEASRVTGSRWGGVQVYWAAEADTVTAKKPKLRRMELELKKLMGLCYLTDELIADAAAMQAVVNKAFPEEFGFVLDDAVLNGVGAGIPLGINNSASRVSVAKEGGQAAATVVAANVLKMFARMPARLVAGAEWFINQDVLPQLPQMVIGTQPVYMAPTGLAGSPQFGYLLGRPVNVIEQAETVGTQGDILFANFGEYVMIDKGGIQQAASMHVRFLNDEQVLRWTYRVDGQPAWADYLTPAKGANKLSPFVVLDAR
jgi:HK97 family phage major capsid protein